jgi:type I restriction enzyme, R subunit
MDTDLYRELTIVLVDRFRTLELHGQGKTFVDRCIRLLKKVRFVGVAQA